MATPSSPTALFDGLADGYVGHSLSTAVQMQPTLVLSFYPYGILMRRAVPGGGCTEYAISPAQLATALAARVQFETGLLSGSTLYVASEGIQKLVAEYRAPQRTALWMDGAETALVVPLPGLVMVRVTTADDNPRYGVYAVKKRPVSLDTPLYLPPLPNMDRSGICWGTVKKVSATGLAGVDLAEDWRVLLGSVFTNHSCGGKSKSHPQDVRQQLIALEQRKCRVYPMSDLTQLELTLGQVLEKVRP